MTVLTRDAVGLPRLTTAQLTGALAAGEGAGALAWDSTQKSVVVSDGANWIAVGGVGSGSGAFVRAKRAAAYSVPFNGWNGIPFDTMMSDALGMGTIGSSRFVCKQPGNYVVAANGTFAQNATGFRSLAITKNVASIPGPDAQIIARDQRVSVGGTDYTSLSCSTTVDLLLNDYIDVLVYQNSGAALAMAINGDTPSFTAVRSGSTAPLRQTLTNATAWSFTGLNGDADLAYEIIIVGYITIAAGVDTWIWCRPNNDSAQRYNGFNVESYLADTGAITAANTYNWTAQLNPVTGLQVVGTGWGLSGAVESRGTFHAKGYAGSRGRTYRGQMTCRPTIATDGRVVNRRPVGHWDPMAAAGAAGSDVTPINRLDFFLSGGGNFTGTCWLKPVAD